MRTPALPDERDDLEDRIRRALHHEADSYRAAPRPDADVLVAVPTRPASSTRAVVLAGAVVIVMVIVVVLAGVWLGGRSSDRRPAGPAPTVPVFTTEPSPVPGAVQVPLFAVGTPEAARMDMDGQSSRGGTATFRSFQADTGPLVTVVDLTAQDGFHTQQLNVETWYNRGITLDENPRPPSGPGWSSSGAIAAGILQVFHYPHWDTPDDPIVFYAWTQVPDGTAYVVYQSEGQLLWQRPVDGVAAFPVHDGPVEATLRAVGTDGVDLATVSVPKSYNGAQYLPGEKEQRRVFVPEYPGCYAIVNAEDGLVYIFDHGTRLGVTITPEEYCAGFHGPIPGLLPYSDDELKSVGIAAMRTYTNGEFVASYVEYELIMENGVVIGGRTTSTPVSPDEVRRRMSARAAAE